MITITRKFKDPFSGFSHLFGALLSIIGLILLVYYASIYATGWHVISFSIFGFSLTLLYTASTVYHLLPISSKGQKILRKIDHMMIYLLIAGTYTPICLIPLRGVWGWSLLSVIWFIAIIGMILKAIWFFNIPRWLSTTLYMLMGWLVIVAFFPLLKTIPIVGIYWLIAGGFLYTIGGIIYSLKWPNINKNSLGYHDIFHIFVLAGSFAHFWLMFKYILYLK